MPPPGEVARDAGDVLSPWPRKSSAQPWATRPVPAAIGAQVMARNPVGWHNSSGGPSPPRSWSASVTPSVDATGRTGGEAGHRPMLAAAPCGPPGTGANRRDPDDAARPVGSAADARDGGRRGGARRRTGATTTRSRPATSTPCPTCGTTTTTSCARIRGGRPCTGGARWPDPGSPCSAGPQHLQFILTDERVHVSGEMAWVTVDENLISEQVGGHGGRGQHVPAHRRAAGGWCCTTARPWRPRRPE